MCCAAGLAVLQVIQDEKLQQRALETGNHMRDLIHALASKPHGELIGEVRGCGLFIGIEFVRDRSTREPATAETSVICSRMKDEFRVIMSIDGPFDSVLVMKPPLCFGKADAELTATCLESILRTLGTIDPNAERTPT